MTASNGSQKRKTHRSLAKTSRQALWVLPFIIGGSLWAAMETRQYFMEHSTAKAQPIILAEAETSSQLEQPSSETSPSSDIETETIDLEGEIDLDEGLEETEIGGSDTSIDLDIDDEPSDYLTVEEILDEDVDAIDAEPVEATPPEEQEFVDLNEILYGTTDEDKIQEIKAQEQGIEVPDRQSLETEMQALKEKVLEINRDLFVLEEDLLFPSSTQVNVFVSFDAKEYFNLDGVTLKIDDKAISNHLYTKRELSALERGAVQRLFTGNLTTGDHELVAVVTGVGPEGRDFRRAVSLDFAKATGTKYIELKIIGDDLRKQPIFQLREWE